MDKLAKLITDIGKLWTHYSGSYFTGIRNTLILAIAATLAGFEVSISVPPISLALSTAHCTKERPIDFPRNEESTTTSSIHSLRPVGAA